MLCLERLKEGKASEQIVEFLDELAGLCTDEGSGNADPECLGIANSGYNIQ